jgi:hypothetical protein
MNDVDLVEVYMESNIIATFLSSDCRGGTGSKIVFVSVCDNRQPIIVYIAIKSYDKT